MRYWKQYWAVVIVVVLAVSSLACSLGGRPGTARQQEETGPVETLPSVKEMTPTLQPAAPTSPPALPTATSIVASTFTAEPTSASPTSTPVPPTPTTEPVAPEQPVPEVPEGQGALDVAQIPELQATTLDPRGTSLVSLGTFRQRMTAEFTASDGSDSRVYRYQSDVNTNDQAVYVMLTTEESATEHLPANQVQAIWIGTRLWVKLGNRPWVPVPEEVAEVQFEEQTVSVGSFLPYVPYFDRVQPDETVNGILCAHYSYDAQDVPSEYGTMDTRGQIWVAIEGGYVVRYTLQAEGTFEQYFDGAGTLRLMYDTYDVGADIQISPPGRR